MSQNVQPEFGKWQSIFWPVHNFELKKLLPMFLMSFFISFNYTILRDTKDTLIVTSCGAGAIPFLKVWGVVPAAILFMVIYARMSNTLSRENLFYASLVPFLVFFASFALILYPFREALQLNGFADSLLNFLPSGWASFVEAVRNWPFSLFYILSELWGSVALSLLFWGFANQITKVNEAKRFYSLFGIGMNIALLISGPCIVYASRSRASLPAGVDPWQVSLNYLMSMVVIAGLIILTLYWWINRNVLTDTRFYDPAQEGTPKKKKAKMGVFESIAFLAKSKYILCLALIVIAYGISINLVEVTWKSKLKEQYSDYNSYSEFMGMFSTFTGIVSTAMMLFVGGNVIRRLGWKFAAYTTPVILLLTGGAFFAFVIFNESLLATIQAMGTTPLYLAVIIGAAQNILSKATKYSMFDPTKEMAYIPLDSETKVKGKAAVDVVGARLGKSGGSLIQMGLLSMMTMSAMTPYIALILLGIIVVWAWAANALGTQFLELQSQKESETAKEPTPAVVQQESAPQAT